jgi:uncharacterized protein (UPF0276 family)
VAELSTTTAIGVGVVYSGALAEVLVDSADVVDVVDVVSVIPETLWHERRQAPRYEWIPAAVRLFDEVAATHPVVFHGIGLSLGSAGPLDVHHVHQLSRAARRYQPRFVSEHLAAFRVGHGRLAAHAGVGLPIAFDSDTLREMAPKVAATSRILDRRLLLENSAIYVEVPYSEWTEAGMLNRLCDATGCGVLLDLHNLHVCELDLGWSADDYLAELDLANVVEIHVAGGEHIGRWYTDAHSGACPQRVWDLLAQVVDAAPNLALVTFELHESRYESLGRAELVRQLSMIRSVVSRRRCHVA